MSETQASPQRQDAAAPQPAWKKWAKIAIVIAVVVALLVLGRQIADYLEIVVEWVEGLGVWGPVIFMLMYAVATVAFIPGSVLTLAGGTLFGLLWGTVYVFVGATTGACASFLISRYVARSRIEKKLEGNEKFAAIDRAVGKQGLKITTLLRLTPAIPFALLNYALGLTKVRFVHYAIACLGMLPGTFLYVYLGKVGGDAATAASTTSAEAGAGWEVWALRAVGLAATIAVTVIVTRIARRALKENTDV